MEAIRAPPAGIPLWWEVFSRAKGALGFHCTQLKGSSARQYSTFVRMASADTSRNFNIYTHPVLQLYLTVRESVTEKGMKIAVGFLAETMTDKRKWRATLSKFNA